MKKVYKILILILIVCMLMYVFNNTYSKYTNKGEIVLKKNVGKWNIGVNGTNIATEDGSVEEFVIDNFVWEQSPHVKEGAVAPGMRGTFSLTLDPKDTDVSFEYSITIDSRELAELNNINLRIANIKVNGVNHYTSKVIVQDPNPDDEELEEDDPDQIFTEDELLGDDLKPELEKEIAITILKKLEDIKSDDFSKKIDNIVVEVEWINDDTHNITDSIIGSKMNNKIILPVKLHCIQYTG